MAKAKASSGKARKPAAKTAPSQRKAPQPRARETAGQAPPPPARPVRAKDVKGLKACPACGSEALAPTQSNRLRTVQRVVAVAALAIPILGPNGKQCLDCGWRID